MGAKIVDQNEILYRQIHPNFYRNGVPGTPAFMPNSSDKNKSPHDRASMTDPKSSFQHYVEKLQRKSACVFGVSVAEFSEHEIECFDDPISAEGNIPANIAHCIADYRDLSVDEQKMIAKELKVKAQQRGCQYLPS